MIQGNAILRQQGKRLLENKRHAQFFGAFLAFLPYTTWLSMAVIALITLRKGWREGLMLLMPCMTVYLGCSLLSLSTTVAITNTLLTFIPCYLATCILGSTANWRTVATGLFLLAMLAAIALQIWMPTWITAQFQYLCSVMADIQPDVLSRFVKDTGGSNTLMLANYLLGIQLLSIVVSAISPLMLARSVQSNLFYPGGFKQEMMMWRGNKLSVLVLVMAVIGAIQGNLIAINALPLLVLYFLTAGLMLCVQVMARKKISVAVFVLVILILPAPFIMIPAYVILGSLDSLFNLRLYLPNKAGSTM